MGHTSYGNGKNITSMDPIRSSLGGGAVASIVLLVVLRIADAVLSGMNLFVFATFMSLCEFGGQPYCELGSPMAAFLTYFWFGVLFVVAWPLIFGAITWGLPGESGILHGLVFGVVLWSGYVVVLLFDVRLMGETVAENLPMLLVTLGAYVVYGLVLGGVYDYLAEHRTFLTQEAVA